MIVYSYLFIGLLKEMINNYNLYDDYEAYILICLIVFENVNKYRSLMNMISSKNETRLKLLKCIHHDYCWNLEGIEITDEILSIFLSLNPLFKELKCLSLASIILL